LYVISILCLIGLFINPKMILSQYRGKGFFIGYDYGVLENPNDGIKLMQQINSNNFTENAFVDYSSYKGLKVLYNPFVRIKEGRKKDRWLMEAGIGLSFSNSQIVASSQRSMSAQVFNYYQLGESISVKEFGISLHADFGTILYAGADLDVGFLKLDASDATSNQEVVGSGGYFSPKFRFGWCLPIVGGKTGTSTKFYVRVFTQFSISNLQAKDLDWKSPDRELIDFSMLSASNIISIPGLALSIVFEDN